MMPGRKHEVHMPAQRKRQTKKPGTMPPQDLNFLVEPRGGFRDKGNDPLPKYKRK